MTEIDGLTNDNDNGNQKIIMADSRFPLNSLQAQ